MKVSEQLISYDIGYIGLEEAEYLGDFKIQLIFHDQKVQTVDFKPFLEKSTHPSIKKYLDESLFTQFKIQDGNLNWGDYDLIFPISELYEGKIA